MSVVTFPSRVVAAVVIWRPSNKCFPFCVGPMKLPIVGKPISLGQNYGGDTYAVVMDCSRTIAERTGLPVIDKTDAAPAPPPVAA